MIRRLARQKDCEVEGGHFMPDREFDEIRRNFIGQRFWARGTLVSTVGRDEEVVRQYIQRQEIEDRRQDQLKFD